MPPGRAVLDPRAPPFELVVLPLSFETRAYLSLLRAAGRAAFPQLRLGHIRARERRWQPAAPAHALMGAVPMQGLGSACKRDPSKSNRDAAGPGRTRIFNRSRWAQHIDIWIVVLLPRSLPRTENIVHVSDALMPPLLMEITQY